VAPLQQRTSEGSSRVRLSRKPAWGLPFAMSPAAAQRLQRPSAGIACPPLPVGSRNGAEGSGEREALPSPGCVSGLCEQQAWCGANPLLAERAQHGEKANQASPTTASENPAHRPSLSQASATPPKLGRRPHALGWLIARVAGSGTLCGTAVFVQARADDDPRRARRRGNVPLRARRDASAAPKGLNPAGSRKQPARGQPPPAYTGCVAASSGLRRMGKNLAGRRPVSRASHRSRVAPWRGSGKNESAEAGPRGRRMRRRTIFCREREPKSRVRCATVSRCPVCSVSGRRTSALKDR